MNEKKVNVTVEYVGNEDYTDIVPPEMALQAIKVHAINKFELDPTSEEKYILQYNSIDMKDTTKIGDIGDNITLILMLKKEVEKG